MLEVKNLHYSIDGNKILKGIDMHFQKGRMTAIIGPNGCGKSTLMSFLGKSRAKSSTVYLEGADITALSNDVYAKRVAMLPQMGETIADFKAREVVLMGRFPYKKRFHDYSESDRLIAEDMMEKVGITHLKERRITSLSGGERQRVLIAKALAQEPELILLDEPTNHLDVKYKVALMEVLSRYEATVVTVLHDLSLVMQYCDDVVVMKQGQIRAFGPVKDIITPALLEEVFEVPFVMFERDGRTYLNY